MSKIKVFAAEPMPWGVKSVSIDTSVCKPVGSGLFGIENGPYCAYKGSPWAGRPVLRLVMKGPRGGDKGRVYFSKEQAMELIAALNEMAQQIP
jgi:hypothetical protein